MKEEWRDIPGFNGKYQASNTGKIRTLITSGRGHRYKEPHILCQVKVGAGYLYTTLVGHNKKHINMLVHRAVAMCFVDGYSDDKEVNHIDGDKTNNRADNLEWISHKSNIDHAINELNRYFGAKKKRIVDNRTGKIYESISEAAEAVGIPSSSISRSAHGDSKMYSGTFDFVDVE